VKGIEVSIAAIRRDGIVGRRPGPESILRGGDVIVLYGTPEALDRGGGRLLTG
jgi:CPA2 family monovalent cation:H+ antiporter-2